MGQKEMSMDSLWNVDEFSTHELEFKLSFDYFMDTQRLVGRSLLGGYWLGA